jgi:RHH-type transcriptional regulator, rel operon repressor / antitoxin RelB
MTQVSAHVPEELLEELDRAATMLARTRAEIIRQAIGYYLDNIWDLSMGLDALRDPADSVLDWEHARAELMAEPTGSP